MIAICSCLLLWDGFCSFCVNLLKCTKVFLLGVAISQNPRVLTSLEAYAVFILSAHSMCSTESSSGVFLRGIHLQGASFQKESYLLWMTAEQGDIVCTFENKSILLNKVGVPFCFRNIFVCWLGRTGN